jgi:dipeptidyl aminopeptidase/acylaminoacyl peptidase
MNMFCLKMKSKTVVLLLLCLVPALPGFSQLKKLELSDLASWNTIQGSQLSPDGRYVGYRVAPNEGDGTLHLYDALTGATRRVARVSKFQYDYSAPIAFGIITPSRDTLRAYERRKKEKKDWPSDTLFIIDPSQNFRQGGVTGYKAPAKVGDWIAYTVKADAFKKSMPATDSIQSDSTKAKPKSDAKKSKKEIEHLVIRQLSTGREDTVYNVKEYNWAEKGAVLGIITQSADSTQTAGVAYWTNFELTYIKKQKGEYAKIVPSFNGSQIAFLGNLDTTKAQVPPWELYYYDFKTDSAASIASKNKSNFPIISQHAEPRWSEDGKYLFYGRAEMPVIRDTTLLADETPKVEIWSTEDSRVYTTQKVNKANDEKKSYTYVFDTDTRQHTPINSLQWEYASYTPDRNGRFAVVYTDAPYLRVANWTGESRKDIAKLDLLTGAAIPIKKSLITTPRMSPGGKYAFGYSEADSTWWAYQLTTGTFTLMSRIDVPSFFDEQNDTPTHPNSYGSAGWINDDQSLILYDRYDVWAWSPDKGNSPQRLTRGREAGRMFRYVRTDSEARSISPADKWLLHVKDETTKSNGYVWFDPAGFTMDSVRIEAFEYGRSATRARNANTILFQKENFQTFPDLHITRDEFETSTKVSDANPQQKQYGWGTIELYHWMDWDSIERSGLLIKPHGYDPMRSYPTIVNFYERSSDDLHNHPTPAPHRSTINYAYYASRGYVIFNPDINYEIGLPGESAYKAVMSGVAALIKQRVVDPDNMALQGHSWGGYQIAYILTRTNQFKCAEAGAAVVNMTSAYGGIRWESGSPRLFQYEKEQSRIGKSLWDDPQSYIANSPLFKVNKIETPLLLMHNDEDGAVPFEQAIEFYLALRRNGKKAWLLNYQGEPHWPVKLENRKDFQMRMSQFFDHYLKGAPQPEWMIKGISAMEVGMKKL